MEQPKEYYAFISYKREDEKWAKRLQHKLEHYHLPANVRKDNPSLPLSIRPVFKDTSELAAGVLADEIHAALDISKYLIVICSPRAAQSKWVGKEVQTFIDMGRSDKIIPFVIGGKPFSENPEEECFPSALLNLPKEQELLGVNINEMGRDAAVVKVVARMFGLKFDALWQRYEREQKKKMYLIVGTALLIGTVGLGLFLYYRMLNNTIFEKNQVLLETISDRDSALEQVREDSVIMAKHLERIQNDSLILEMQKDSILLQKDEIAQERDNVLKANWRILETRARAVSKTAIDLTTRGEAVRGIAMIMRITPKDMYKPNTPFVPEMERALRTAHDSLEYGLSYDSFVSCKKHLGIIMSGTFSNNGKYVFTGSNDKYARVWDTETGEEFSNMRMLHNGSVSDICISPNDSFIVTTQYGLGPDSLFLWAIQGGKIVRVRSLGEGQCPSFSPDGKFLFTQGIYNQGGVIRSTESWEIIKNFNKKEKLEDDRIVISPDWEYYANSFSIDTITTINIHRLSSNLQKQRIYDDNPKWSYTKRTHGLFSPSVYFSHNSDYCMISMPNGISGGHIAHLINIHSGEIEKSEVLKNDGDIVFSKKSDHFFMFKNNKLICWDIKQWKEIDNRCFPLPYTPQKIWESHVNDKIGVGFDNGITCVFCGLSSLTKRTPHVLICDTSCDIKLCPNNNVYIKRMGEYKTIMGEKMLLHNDTIFLVNKSNRNVLCFFRHDISGDVALSKNGQLLAKSSSANTQIMDFNNNLLLEIPNGGKVCFSNNSNYIAVCNSGKVQVWNIKNKTIISQLQGHKNNITSLCFSNDDKILVTASYDRTIRIWNWYQKTEIKQIHVNSNIYGCAISPNNSYLSTVDGHRIQIYDIKSGIMLNEILSEGCKDIIFLNDIKIQTANGNEIHEHLFVPLTFLFDKYAKFRNFRFTKEEKTEYYLE